MTQPFLKNPAAASTSPRRLWLAGSAFTALTAVSAISAAVFGLGTAEADSPPPAPPATPVSVAAVQASDVATWNEFSGRLEAVERVELRPRVPGTVQSVHFREGALVKQGDLLITIDPAPYAADVDRAEAQVAAAKARALYTGSDVARANPSSTPNRGLSRFLDVGLI